MTAARHATPDPDSALDAFRDADGRPYDRYVVVGTSGSGKTTLARRLSGHLGVPHVELDALHWLPDWQMRSTAAFRELVDEATARPRWVVDGNYGSKVRDIVWSRADAVVWLDRSRPVVMARVIWRSLKRAVTGEELWGSGNRETLGRMVSSDSIVSWAWNTWPERRAHYPKLLDRPEHRHLDVFRVTSADLSQVTARRDREACPP